MTEIESLKRRVLVLETTLRRTHRSLGTTVDALDMLEEELPSLDAVLAEVRAQREEIQYVISVQTVDYEAAVKVGHDEERAAIVAWLRIKHEDSLWSPDRSGAWQSYAGEVADAIQVHAKEKSG